MYVVLFGDGVEIPFAVFLHEDDVVFKNAVPAAVEMHGVKLHFVPNLVVDVVGAVVVGDDWQFGGEGGGGEEVGVFFAGFVVKGDAFVHEGFVG